MSGFEPYFLKTQWCVAQAVEQADIDFLLEGGWEPYATQFHPTLGQTIHYFRKQKRTNPGEACAQLAHTDHEGDSHLEEDQRTP